MRAIPGTVTDRRNTAEEIWYGHVPSQRSGLVKGLAPLKRFRAMWKVVVDIIWIASARTEHKATLTD